jgi:hypothetical protein
MPQNFIGQITSQVGNKAIGSTAEQLQLGGALTVLEVLAGSIWFQAKGGTATVNGTDCTKMAAGDGIEIRNPVVSVISDATGATIQYLQFGDQA